MTESTVMHLQRMVQFPKRQQKGCLLWQNRQKQREYSMLVDGDARIVIR